jgi:tetrapyrrole methylase family protein/MazG family protein
MTITIVGLGPGDALEITREAWSALVTADEVYVRTELHPAVKGLPDHLSLHSFDHVYEQAESFDQVYDTITAQVIRLGQRPQGVVYAVPGHPLVGESTVTRILKLAEQAGLSVRIINGVSFITPILVRLRMMRSTAFKWPTRWMWRPASPAVEPGCADHHRPAL